VITSMWSELGALGQEDRITTLSTNLAHRHELQGDKEAALPSERAEGKPLTILYFRSAILAPGVKN
jgi:hypothetical protein